MSARGGRSVFVGIGLAAAFALGCGGKAEATGAGGEGSTSLTPWGSVGSLSLQEFGRAVAETVCGIGLRCSDRSLLINYGLAGPACVSYFEDALWKSVDELQAGVQSGRYRYDPAAAGACVQRIRDRCWVPSGDLVEWCPSAFHGAAVLGEPCESVADCASDAYCSGSFYVCGVCTARVPLGGECFSEGPQLCAGAGDAESVACVGGDGFSTPGNCVQVVVSIGAEGAPCDTETLEGNTETRTTCGPGLQCIRDLEQPVAVCQPLLAEGAACTRTGQNLCEAGTGCWLDANREGTCLPHQVRGAGETCNQGVQNCTRQPDGSTLCDVLEAQRCDEGLVCNDGTCEPQPGVGEPCEVNEFQANGLCQKELVCLEAELICTLPRLDGRSCSRQNECTSGYCNGVCGPHMCSIP